MTFFDIDLLRERVSGGAEFLDEVDPGWAASIDPSTLDLTGCDECILGQRFGGFREGMDKLGLTLSVTRVLGLNYDPRPAGWQGPLPGSREAERDEADQLRTFWLEEIRERTEV